MMVGFVGYGQKRVEKSRTHKLPLGPFSVSSVSFAWFSRESDCTSLILRAWALPVGRLVHRMPGVSSRSCCSQLPSLIPASCLTVFWLERTSRSIQTRYPVSYFIWHPSSFTISFEQTIPTSTFPTRLPTWTSPRCMGATRKNRIK